MELPLKYGLNPHQQPAKLTLPVASPIRVLNGTPGYVNIIDAMGAWQLARELKNATGVAGAASFKHASPAGAAIAGNLDEAYLASQFLARKELSPVASAYVRGSRSFTSWRTKTRGFRPDHRPRVQFRGS